MMSFRHSRDDIEQLGIYLRAVWLFERIDSFDLDGVITNQLLELSDKCVRVFARKQANVDVAGGRVGNYVSLFAAAKHLQRDGIAQHEVVFLVASQLFD